MAKVIPNDNILLELTEEEAKTLLFIIYFGVGGEPKTSRRGFADNIFKALREKLPYFYNNMVATDQFDYWLDKKHGQEGIKFAEDDDISL